MAEEFEQDGAEKTEEPTQYRIEEFRKRGEVASSKELTSILVLSASLLTLTISAVYIYEVMDYFIRWAYALDVNIKDQQEFFRTLGKEAVFTALKCALPIFVVVVCTVVIANVAQIGWLFSPEILSIKLERINPINGFKRLFSMNSIIEVTKGIFKFVFILAIVYWFMRDDLEKYKGFYHVEFFQSFIYGKTMLVNLILAIIVSLMVIALGDLAYQKFTYQKKLRMTKEQAKREQKEREGNPEIRQRIRTIQREIANKRMIDDVKKADVVVTNPTHISVALRFDAKSMISPKIVAKGADHLAMQIRKVAKEAGVPLVENVPLARTLYKTVKLNSFIPRTLYQAVADVLRFVYELKRKEKALG